MCMSSSMYIFHARGNQRSLWTRFPSGLFVDKSPTTGHKVADYAMATFGICQSTCDVCKLYTTGGCLLDTAFKGVNVNVTHEHVNTAIRQFSSIATCATYCMWKHDNTATSKTQGASSGTGSAAPSKLAWQPMPVVMTICQPDSLTVLSAWHHASITV